MHHFHPSASNRIHPRVHPWVHPWAVFILLTAFAALSALTLTACGGGTGAVKPETKAEVPGYKPSLPNIAGEFYPVASSVFEKKKDNFIASAENTVDENPETYWMNARPIKNQNIESIVFLSKDKYYIDAIRVEFIGTKVWDGVTNDVLPKNFGLVIRTDGKEKQIRNGHNTEETPMYAVNLSNADRIKITMVAGDKDGYARIKEISVYGSITEKASNTYKYKMSGKEEKLLAASSLIYGERRIPVSDDDSQGRQSMAQSFYNNAMNKVIAVNREVLKENPKNPYARMNLGQVYAELGNNSEETKTRDKYMAMSEKELLAADRPDNPELKGLYKYLMSFYREKLDQKNYSIYEQKLLALTTGEGNKGEYYRTLANSDPYGNQYGGDIYRYASGSGDLKGFGTVLWRYTTLLVRQKKYGHAVEVGNFTIESYPNLERVQDGQVYQYVALANMALGKWQVAIEAWRGYVNMLPLKGIENGYLMNCYIYSKIGDVNKAYQNWIVYKTSGEQFKKLNENSRAKISEIRKEQYSKDGFGGKTGSEIRGKYSVYDSNQKIFPRVENIINSSSDEKYNHENVEKEVQSYLLKYGIK